MNKTQPNNVRYFKARYFYNDLDDAENYYLKVSSSEKNVFVRKDEVEKMKLILNLKSKLIHTTNIEGDGTLKELKTELPQLVEGDKRHNISGVQEKSDGIYIRFFNGLYTRWNKLAPTDEIVFNDKNYKLMWAN